MIIIKKVIFTKKDEQLLINFEKRFPNTIHKLLELDKNNMSSLVVYLIGIQSLEIKWIPNSVSEYQELLKLHSQLLNILYNLTAMANLTELDGRYMLHGWKNILRDYLLPSIENVLNNYKIVNSL
ncbi:hypothetical protein [Limosilactobacillus caviae]|uniref:hypothetical protein n=1 Tax=Limosilactobacillus caviae TaxID=1769424 RepID=UPI00129BB833|nr:hypothetical protein [Limosilactobacillus caviae]MCD7125496.1 hypothetical protein [Limosilactobacillus caviae]MRH47278.1 hypothetical protein [Limosilactobacillus reuteri]